MQGPEWHGPRRCQTQSRAFAVDRRRRLPEVGRVAQAPTLHDFEIVLNDADRGLNVELRVKTARHPSETIERVWLRLLAYCWKYEERLVFGPGLSDTDAPDLLATDLTGQVTRWIRVGKIEPAKLQRAIDQHPSAKVSVLFESAARFEQLRAAAGEGAFPRLAGAELAFVDPALLSQLATGEDRRARITLTLVGDSFYLDRGGKTFEGEIQRGTLG
jgi:uncharacterized protein YaeQ